MKELLILAEYDMIKALNKSNVARIYAQLNKEKLHKKSKQEKKAERKAKRKQSNFYKKRDLFYKKKKQQKRERSDDYNAYIDSPEWQLKRDEAFALYGKACQKCKSKKKLHVHHMTYARFKNELVSDLAVLCNTCHHEYHELNRHTGIKTTKDFIASGDNS